MSHGKRPSDFGFQKIEDHGNSYAIWEKQTPDHDPNPRVTADRYGGAEEWVVKLEAPDGSGGLAEQGFRQAWSRGEADTMVLELIREYEKGVGL